MQPGMQPGMRPGMQPGMANPDAYRPYTPQYGGPQGPMAPGFSAIGDRFGSIEQVQMALRQNGMTAANLIIAVDYTKSNEETGAVSFGGRCLHSLIPGQMNPYQRVIDILGRTLASFDADGQIPVYGFGDTQTQGSSCFPFYPGERPCQGVQDVLQRYQAITPTIQLWGPTSFAPVIRKAISLAQSTRQLQILVIVADGQVNDNGLTRQAIIEASNYPISIITVGVGDGPWPAMREFDDGLTQRRFDNFQFVDFTAIASRGGNVDVAFALQALQEVPEQLAAMRRLNLVQQ
eukprot:TRINITY_DN1429_c0_g3_i4.p1 TRINITY_DN1429_c0_g3~~TRINITY_DN1429_c0_g3_i4.p1  ORF type:complete len:291 (-),score=41.26 TRINITY_DN1429_c0_g3_i4:142-1014(-)